MSSKKKILHILDPSIISESTFSLFEKLDFQQRYVVVSGSTDNWKLDRKQLDKVVFLQGNDKELIDQLKEEIKSADIIFLQALSVLKAKAINAVNDKTKFYIWGLWGYALYNMAQYFKYKQSSYSTQLDSNPSLLQKIKDYYTFRIVYKKAVKKLDMCLFLLESDYQLLGEIIQHRAIWRTACYQTIENILPNPEFKVNGNSILIGNSSTPSNRHELVFEILGKVNDLDRKAITPLNYGDPDYKQKMLEMGEEKLGSSFEPIVDFLSLDAYTKRIQSCSHVIMAHERQQAFGTILTMLFAGSKLYLSKSSPFYIWFRELGIQLYSVEDDLAKEIYSELDESLKEMNREIILKNFSESVILNKLTGVVEDTIHLSKQKEL